MTHLSVVDVVFVLLALFIAVMYLGVLPSEARAVRDGHMRKPWWSSVVMGRTKGDRRPADVFFSKYRRKLTTVARIGLVWGTILLVMAVVFTFLGESPSYWVPSLGGMLLIQGVGCLRARRILDTPPGAERPSGSRFDPSQDTAPS